MLRTSTDAPGIQADRRPTGMPVVALIAASLLATAICQAQVTNVVNLTSATFDGEAVDTTTISSVTVTGAFIGDAFFRFGLGGSGSGVYRKMYNESDSTVSTNDPQEGYNRPNTMDVGNLQGFDYDIHMSNLITDKSGEYYVFALDINQVGGTARFLSLDDVQIFSGPGTGDPSPLPTNTAGMVSAFGAPIYAMNNSSTQSYVIMDSSLSAGSGAQDLFLFVKKSLFNGVSAGDHIYLYSAFGTYSLYDPARTQTTPNDGFEEWALPITSDVQVPEPPAFAFATLATLFGLAHRCRRRR